MKKLFVCLVILSMIICCVPAMAFANSESDSVKSVSKSKEATNLDEQFTSQITLSLPSVEEQLVTDVVFVLDKSTSTDIENEALNMLENLKEQANQTGAKIKVGVVIFNKVANETLSLTELNDANMSSIESAIKEEISSGTNLHAGILAGKEMLDNDQSVDANRKYMIVVSDGITYMFNEEPTSVAWSWTADSVQNWAGPDNWYGKYGSNDAPTDWSQYLSNIGAQIEKDGTQYDYPYGGTPEVSTPAEEYTEHANSIDKALYLSYQAYQEAAAAGYNCYAMTADTGTEYAWGPSFMTYLGGGTDVSFNDIQNDIAYAVSTGSYVIDTMGNDELNGKAYNFDFINELDKIDVSVGGTKLDKEKVADNHYGFGKTASGYRFEVIYYPEGTENSNGEECIKWLINEDISNFSRVQLIYSVQLSNPQTEEGTYGQYDKNGSQGFDGLYTNNSAVLYPVDSDGVAGEAQVFNKPTVSYVVEKADVTEPNPPTDNGGEDVSDDSSDVTSDTPKTEDSSTMTAALIVMALSAGAFAALLRKRKTSV